MFVKKGSIKIKGEVCCLFQSYFGFVAVNLNLIISFSNMEYWNSTFKSMNTGFGCRRGNL